MTHGCYRFILLLIAGGLLSSIAIAAPDWVKEAPKSDDRYHYYVGYSEFTKTIEATRHKAVLVALGKAISENYATILGTEIPKEFGTPFFNRIQILLKRVEFRNLEWVDTFRETNRSQTTKLWMLLRLENPTIQTEKNRLTKLVETDKSLTFTEEGSAEEADKGILEVTSDPPGAEVSVDDNLYGVSPIRIIGKLEPGSHSLRLRLEGQDTWGTDITILPGENVRIDKALAKGVGKLTLTSEPNNAAVFVNGLYQGVTPLKAMLADADEKLAVTLLHSEAQATTEAVEIKPEENKTVAIKMLPKPASLVVQSQPGGAIVYVDGKGFGSDRTPTSATALDPGLHTVTLEKEGYHDFTTIVSIRGGETRTLSNVKLFALSDVERVDIEREQRRIKKVIRFAESPLHLGLTGGISGKSSEDANASGFQSIGVMGEKWWGKRYGVRIAASYDSGGSGRTSDYAPKNVPHEDEFDLVPDLAQDSSNPYFLTGWSASIGLLTNLVPIDYRDNVYFAIELGILRHTYQGLYTMVENVGVIPHTDKQINQSRIGFAFCYEFLPRAEAFGASAKLGFNKYGESAIASGTGTVFTDLNLFVRF